MIKLKDILFDFLNYIFLLFLVIFCILYFIVGDRFFAFTKILESLIPLSIFGIIFLLRLKFNRQKIKKFRKEISIEEVAVYFTKTQIFQDWIVVGILPFSVIIITVFNKTINSLDIIQGLLAGGIGCIAHLYLFKKHKDTAVLYFANRLEKLIDEIIIFLLPMAVYSIALFQLGSVLSDIFQALAPFLLLFLWRQRLFAASKTIN